MSQADIEETQQYIDAYRKLEALAYAELIEREALKREALQFKRKLSIVRLMIANGKLKRPSY